MKQGIAEEIFNTSFHYAEDSMCGYLPGASNNEIIKQAFHNFPARLNHSGDGTVDAFLGTAIKILERILTAGRTLFSLA